MNAKSLLLGIWPAGLAIAGPPQPSSAFVYTEIDRLAYPVCGIKPGRFVEDIQEKLRAAGVTIIGPGKGEQLAFYANVSAKRSDGAALMGGCVSQVTLTVFRPTITGAAEWGKGIPAKAVFCQKASLVTAATPVQMQSEVSAVLVGYSLECLGLIRNNLI